MPSAKGAKAKSVEKISVEQLLLEMQNTSFSISEQPYGSLFDLYNQEFLQKSVSKKLIHPEALVLAGDGTPFITSARERKHRICDCASKGINDCSCDRYFSQPDCDIGWDSSCSCFYHGYDLYMLVAISRRVRRDIVNTFGKDYDRVIYVFSKNLGGRTSVNKTELAL